MSQFDRNLSVDFKGLKYKSNTGIEDTERKFEESQVQFIPVQIHNEGQRHKYPCLRSEHCYSRAELRAITKFNRLFKKTVVLPSKNKFSDIELSTHIKLAGRSIPEENAPRHKIISAFNRTCCDLGHSSKEIQMTEENELLGPRKNQNNFREPNLFQQSLIEHIFKNFFLMRIKSEQTAANQTNKRMQHMFHSHIKHYCGKEISECRIQKHCKKSTDARMNKKNSNHNKNNHRISSYINESNTHDECYDSGKVNMDCKKVHEEKKTNIRPLTMRNKDYTIVPDNKNYLEIISSGSHNENFFEKKSVFHIAHKTDKNRQIDPRSSAAQVMFRSTEEELTDLKMKLDKVIRYLEDIIDSRINFRFQSVGSFRTIKKIICEHEKNTNHNGKSDIKYNHEGNRENRLRALIKQIKCKTKCICARRIHQKENRKNSNEKLDDTEHSQNIGGIFDNKRDREKSNCKKKESLFYDNIGTESKLVELNIRKKDYCRDPFHDISKTFHTIDENRKEDREKKLEELLKVILKKREYICQEILGGVYNSIDGAHRNSSTTESKLSRTVSFSDEHFKALQATSMTTDHICAKKIRDDMPNSGMRHERNDNNLSEDLHISLEEINNYLGGSLKPQNTADTIKGIHENIVMEKTDDEITLEKPETNLTNFICEDRHPSKQLYANIIKSMSGEFRYYKHSHDKMRREKKNKNISLPRGKTRSLKLSNALPSIEENTSSQQNYTTEAKANICTKKKNDVEREITKWITEASKIIETQVNALKINKDTRSGIQKYSHKRKNIDHMENLLTKLNDTMGKRQPGSKRNIQSKETKSELSGEFPPISIHEKSNSNKYDNIQTKRRIFTKRITEKIYANTDVCLRDGEKNMCTYIRTDLENIRKGKIPKENFDSKFNLDDDEIDIVKFAKYADIIEDISLERAMEMEEFLCQPFIKEK